MLGFERNQQTVAGLLNDFAAWEFSCAANNEEEVAFLQQLQRQYAEATAAGEMLMISSNTSCLLVAQRDNKNCSCTGINACTDIHRGADRDR